MSANANTIWNVPAYLPMLQPALSNELIAATEQSMGYPLPAQYLDLLRVQNGGYIRYVLPALDGVDMNHRQIAGIGPRLPSLTGIDLAEEFQDVDGHSLQGLFPFDGGGLWFLCLDYRRNPSEPEVTYIDLERKREVQVASSFACYLTMLQLDTEGRYVLEDCQDIEHAVARLSALLSVSFELPELLRQGYPTYRARLMDGQSPAWLWVSPNWVPRSYLPESALHDQTIIAPLQGYAARFPEAPRGACLVQVSDGMLQEVLTACGRAGWMLYSLEQRTVPGSLTDPGFGKG